MLAVRLARASAPALARTGLAARMAPLSSKAVAATGPKGELSTEKAPEPDRSTLSAFTGAPADMMEKRVVKIYQQAQTVQNATQNMIAWRLQ